MQMTIELDDEAYELLKRRADSLTRDDAELLEIEPTPEALAAMILKSQLLGSEPQPDDYIPL